MKIIILLILILLFIVIYYAYKGETERKTEKENFSKETKEYNEILNFEKSKEDFLKEMKK